MHSGQMSRRSQKFEQANVGVGSDFTPAVKINAADTRRKLKAWTEKRGLKPLNLKNRTLRLFEKIKKGLIPKETVDKIYRDHKAEYIRYFGCPPSFA